MKPKLILFDIDHTLIDPGGAGRRAMTEDFYEIFSIPDAFSRIKMAGKTDLQILKEGLLAHDISWDGGIVSTFLSTYVEKLKRTVKDGVKTRKVNPGVIELLEAIEARKGYWQGLLTGNVEQGARVKLGAFGLNRYFSFGAFGDDDEDRNRLLPIAIRKFRNLTGIELSFADCVVIGDTPSDVACSKPFGSISIGVTTGPYSRTTLLEAGAHYVFDNLSHAMDTILGNDIGKGI